MFRPTQHFKFWPKTSLDSPVSLSILNYPVERQPMAQISNSTLNADSLIHSPVDKHSAPPRNANVEKSDEERDLKA